MEDQTFRDCWIQLQGRYGKERFGPLLAKEFYHRLDGLNCGHIESIFANLIGLGNHTKVNFETLDELKTMFKRSNSTQDSKNTNPECEACHGVGLVYARAIAGPEKNEKKEVPFGCPNNCYFNKQYYRQWTFEFQVKPVLLESLWELAPRHQVYAKKCNYPPLTPDDFPDRLTEKEKKKILNELIEFLGGRPTERSKKGTLVKLF